MAFPGGVRAPGDVSLEDAAKRGEVTRSDGVFPCIRAGGNVIWGLAYRILEHALPMLRA